MSAFRKSLATFLFLLVAVGALSVAGGPGAAGNSSGSDAESIDVDAYERAWSSEKASKVNELLRKHRVFRDATGRPLPGKALAAAQAEFDAWEQQRLRAVSQDPRRDQAVERALGKKGVTGKNYRFTGSAPKDSRGTFSDYEIEFQTKEQYERAVAAIKALDPTAEASHYRIESKKYRFMGWAPGVPRTLDLVGDQEVLLHHDDTTVAQHTKKVAPLLDRPIPTDPFEQDQHFQTIAKTLLKSNLILDHDEAGTYLTPEEVKLLKDIKVGRDANGRCRMFGTTGVAAVADLTEFRDKVTGLLAKMNVVEREANEKRAAEAATARARAEADLEAARKGSDSKAIAEKQATAEAAKKRSLEIESRNRGDRVTLSILKAKHPRAAKALGLDTKERSARKVLSGPGGASEPETTGSRTVSTLGVVSAGASGYMREQEDAQRENRDVDLRRAAGWSILYGNKWTSFALGVGDAVDANRAYLNQMIAQERSTKGELGWADDLRLAAKGYAHLLGLTTVQIAQALPSGVGDVVFGSLTAWNLGSSWGEAYKARADLLTTRERNRVQNDATVRRFSEGAGWGELTRMRTCVRGAQAIGEDFERLRAEGRALDAALEVLRRRAGDAMETCTRLQEAQGRKAAGAALPPLPDGNVLAREIGVVTADALDLAKTCDRLVSAYGEGTRPAAEIRADAEGLGRKLPDLLARYRAADARVAELSAAAGFREPLVAASLQVEQVKRETLGFASYAREFAARWRQDEHDLADWKRAFDDSDAWLREKISIFKGSEAGDAQAGLPARAALDPRVAESALLVDMLEEAADLRSHWPKTPSAEGGISDLDRLTMGIDGMAKAIAPCEVLPPDPVTEARERDAGAILERLARPIADMTDAMRQARDAVARLDQVYQALREQLPASAAESAPAEAAAFGDLFRRSWEEVRAPLGTRGSDRQQAGHVVLGFTSEGPWDKERSKGPPPHRQGYAKMMEEGKVNIWRDANWNGVRDRNETTEAVPYWFWLELWTSSTLSWHISFDAPLRPDGIPEDLVRSMAENMRTYRGIETPVGVGAESRGGWSKGPNNTGSYVLQVVEGHLSFSITLVPRLEIDGFGATNPKFLAPDPELIGSRGASFVDSRWSDDAVSRWRVATERIALAMAQDAIVDATALHAYEMATWWWDSGPFLPELPGFTRTDGSHGPHGLWASCQLRRPIGKGEERYCVEIAGCHAHDKETWADALACVSETYQKKLKEGDKKRKSVALPGAENAVLCGDVQIWHPSYSKDPPSYSTYELLVFKKRNIVVSIKAYAKLPGPESQTLRIAADILRRMAARPPGTPIAPPRPR